MNDICNWRRASSMSSNVQESGHQTVAPGGGIAISGHVTGARDLLVPGRVTAASAIQQGSFSAPIDPRGLMGKPDVQQISVEVSPDGLLDLDSVSSAAWHGNVHWVRALRLSEDCHSFNVQLKLQIHPKPKLMVQTVRPIEAGQELQLWFAEEVLAMLQVAFLTPSNIQGQKKYVCMRCAALYESPNPLKLHMTLSCGKQNISHLWQRLASLIANENLHKANGNASFSFKLSPEPVIRQRSAIDLTMTRTSKEIEKGNLYRPYSEPSAFRPFRKEEMHLAVSTPTILPMNFDQEVQIHPGAAYHDEAQIESLVSSLGKSRQGHICLYCGKCYSRKYGLKIHIRTHTGYKPLKCKFCSRPFGDPSNLNKHVRLHAEGNTPYKCDLCGKILVRRRDLERHLKSRHMIEMNPDMNLMANAKDEVKSVSDSENKSSD
nr:unnamed protein product [Callosobruchus analis]